METPFKDMRSVLDWEATRMGAVSASTLRAAIAQAEGRQGVLCALLAEAGAVLGAIDPESTDEADRLNDLQIRMTSARHEVAAEQADIVWPKRIAT